MAAAAVAAALRLRAAFSCLGLLHSIRSGLPTPEPELTRSAIGEERIFFWASGRKIIGKPVSPDCRPEDRPVTSIS